MSEFWRLFSDRQADHVAPTWISGKRVGNRFWEGDKLDGAGLFG